MSVIFDQLRISDDGQKLYLDAHVNKASYFENMSIKKVTVCTEEQVSELQPKLYGSKFIYQTDVHPVDTLSPLYGNVQILSEKNLMDVINSDGGWNVRYTPPSGVGDSYLSTVFSGKFSVFEDGTVPKLVVATTNFDALTEGFESPEVLFTIDGEKHSEKGHDYWLFKGKGLINGHTNVQLHLFKEGENGAYEPVGLDERDDVNFLHFLWQVWYTIPGTSQKEVHLLLSKASFDEAFNNTNEEGEAINPALPIATDAYNGSLSEHMFFVYIECEGVPAIDTPCGLDEVTVGVTFDYGAIYQKAMGYTRQLANDCQMPQGFVDFMLNTEALKLSLETEHYFPAINYWKWLKGTDGGTFSNNLKGCGCHG